MKLKYAEKLHDYTIQEIKSNKTLQILAQNDELVFEMHNIYLTMLGLGFHMIARIIKALSCVATQVPLVLLEDLSNYLTVYNFPKV